MIILYTHNGYAQVDGTDTAAFVGVHVKEAVKSALVQAILSQQLEKTAAQKLMGDTALTDSIGRLVINRLRLLREQAGSSIKTSVQGTFRSSGDVLRVQLEAVLHTNDIKALINQCIGLAGKPFISLTNGNMTMEAQMAPSALDGANTFSNSTLVNTSWSVLGIPVGLRLVHQDMAGRYNYSANNVSVEFDRQAYLNTIRNALQVKFNEEQMKENFRELIEQGKGRTLAALQSSTDELRRLCATLPGEFSIGAGTAADMLKTDLATLESQLRPHVLLQQLELQQLKLQELQQGGKNGKDEHLLKDSIAATTQSVLKIQRLIGRIKSLREDALENGFNKMIAPGATNRLETLKEQLTNPEALPGLARQALGLKGLQSIFLYMHYLKAGVNTANLSPLSVYQFVNNGINAAFYKNKHFLFLMAAKQKELNSVFDARHAMEGSLPNNTVMGVRFGSGDIGASHTHFSLFTYKQSGGSFNGVPAAPGNTAVATVSSRLQLNTANYIAAELSKSSHRYTNQFSFADTLQMRPSAGKALVIPGNITQQMAFDLVWVGGNKDKELNYNMHAGSTGSAYTNPGNSFLMGGTTELGGSIRKNFLRSRLRIAANAQYRNYRYAAVVSAWRSSQYALQASWKFNKAQYIMLRFQPSQSWRIQNGVQQRITGNNRVSAEGMFSKRIHNIIYQHTLSITGTRASYQVAAGGVQSHAWQLNSSQRLIAGSRTWYVNTLYNHALSSSDFLFFNTQLNMEAGAGYTICNRLAGTTTATYRSICNWFRQAGIRQSINGQLSKRCSLSLYADIVKTFQLNSAIRPMGSRLDCSIQYLLK